LLSLNILNFHFRFDFNNLILRRIFLWFNLLNHRLLWLFLFVSIILFHLFFFTFLIFIIFLPSFGYNLTHLFVFFPARKLAFSSTVPFTLALWTSHCCWITTIRTFGIIVKLVKYIWTIKLHDAFESFIWLTRTFDKEVFKLKLWNFGPVLSFDDFCSHFRHLLNNERILFCYCIFAHHWQFLKSSKHLC